MHDDQHIQTIADALLHTLRAIEKSTGKRPNSRELGEMVAQAIDNVTDQIADLTTKQVVDVALKTRDRSATKVSPGDVFVCCIDAAYFYGRVLDSLQLGTLLEFWDLPRNRRLSLNEICSQNAKPILHRYVFANSLFNKANCRVIGNWPVPKNHEYPLFFLLGGALHHPRNKKQGRLQIEQVLHLEPTHTYPGQLLLDRLASFGLKKTWPETATCRKQVLKILK